MDYSLNQIIHLKDNSFGQSYKPVTSLFLQRNIIKNIDPGAFTVLTKLKILDLSYNGIEEIKDDTFKHNKRVRFLNLGHNKLKFLPERAFHEMSDLTHIELNDNDLVHVFPNTFTGPAQIERLYLHNNHLQTAHKEWFINLHLFTENYGDRSSEIYLDNNDFSCDCRMKDFYNWIINHSFFKSAPNPGDSNAIGRLTTVRCNYPLSEKGKTIDKVDPSILVCKKPLMLSKSQKIKVELGDSLDLTCDATGIPDPELVFEVPKQKGQTEPQIYNTFTDENFDISVQENLMSNDDHIDNANQDFYGLKSISQGKLYRLF